MEGAANNIVRNKNRVFPPHLLHTKNHHTKARSAHTYAKSPSLFSTPHPLPSPRPNTIDMTCILRPLRFAGLVQRDVGYRVHGLMGDIGWGRVFSLAPVFSMQGNSDVFSLLPLLTRRPAPIILRPRPFPIAGCRFRALHCVRLLNP